MDHIEKKILELIDQNAEKIIAFGDDIWHHAELGFMEHRTSQKFAEQLEAMGLSCERNIAVTGVKSYLNEKKEGEVRLALMGELDALVFPDHVDANPETGAAHCCGHNAQLTGVMGAALALTDPEVRAALGGNVVFYGVPCEEASTAPEEKKKLREAGLIHSPGGKCEMIRQGAVDDIDLVVGHHVNGGAIGANDYVISNATSMGFLEKHVHYTGIRQHPAFSFRAVDALAAATLAMHAVDQQREAMNMFHRRNVHMVHGFIAKGGTATNIVSDDVDVEYNLRAAELNDMLDMSYRVDRSLRAGAIATGAGVEIQTEPGYLPIIPLKDVSFIEDVFKTVDPEHKHEIHYLEGDELSGTTDYGDLSNLMPVMQFMTVGHSGVCHTNQFCVVDPYEYYIVPAKCFALLAYRLLKDDAALAKKVMADYTPVMTKEGYVQLMDSLSKTETMPLSPAPVPDFYK